MVLQAYGMPLSAGAFLRGILVRVLVFMRFTAKNTEAPY
jgi:hypothetical protein